MCETVKEHGTVKLLFSSERCYFMTGSLLLFNTVAKWERNTVNLQF